LTEEKKAKIKEEEKYRTEAREEAEKKPLLKQNIGCGGFILIIIIIIVIMVAIFSGNGEKKSTGSEVSQPTIQEEEVESNAFMLASLEIGHNYPSESLVKTFDDLLEKLKKKCPQESEKKIANYIFKGQKLIKEGGGGTVKLLDFGNALNGSISEETIGVVSCAEMASALVVLMTATK